MPLLLVGPRAPGAAARQSQITCRACGLRNPRPTVAELVVPGQRLYDSGWPTIAVIVTVSTRHCQHPSRSPRPAARDHRKLGKLFEADVTQSGVEPIT